MTDIAFHTGIADPLDYACRLLRKAYRSGARAAVYGEPGLLDRLDQALWTFEPLEFVPHLLLPRDGADPARLAATPVVFLSGRLDPEDRLMGQELGAADFLRKSADTRELVSRVKMLSAPTA